MPKKKKVNNTSAESTLKYTGQVTIERVRANKVVSKKVIKNTGCLPLFKFFANCLTIATPENAAAVGLFNSKPQFLNCFYKSQADIAATGIDFDTQQVKSYMKQTGVYVESSEGQTTTPDSQENAYWMVNIRFLLQDNNFKKFDNVLESSKINILALYGADNLGTQKLPHAFIVIPKLQDYLQYEEGVNFIITWSLKLSNK